MLTSQYHGGFDLEGAISARTPTGHIGGPECGANVMGLLLSHASAYTTASTVVVDGGWSIQGWQSV